MIKLIASDLDGTLLQDGTQELTPRAISLIHSLTQKGIHFVAASGRQYTNERIVFDKIKDEIAAGRTLLLGFAPAKTGSYDKIEDHMMLCVGAVSTNAELNYVKHIQN